MNTAHFSKLKEFVENIFRLFLINKIERKNIIIKNGENI